jgi:hypothetical protein
MDKPKVVIDYAKLTPELNQLFNETYPNGIVGHTIRYPNSKGEIVTSVRLETDDKIYLVKLSTRAKEVLSDEDLDEMIRPLSKGSVDEDVEVEDEEESDTVATDAEPDDDDE